LTVTLVNLESVGLRCRYALLARTTQSADPKKKAGHKSEIILLVWGPFNAHDRMAKSISIITADSPEMSETVWYGP